MSSGSDQNIFDVRACTWHLCERARPVLHKLKGRYGQDWYEEQKTSFKKYLHNYAVATEGLLDRKQGKSISPVACEPGCRCLKVRWLLPGLGKSGGLRLGVAICPREQVDGPLAQTTGTSLDNLLEQRKRAKSRGIWSVALARELVSRAEHRDPECMCTMVPVCEPGSWIHIAVNCMYSARVPKRRIQLIGAALAAAVCALESAGNRVWVTAFWGVTGYDEGSAWLCSLTLKEYLSELDTDCLGFWVTNASAFRRVIFSLMETHPVEFRELFGVSADGGYGSPFCAEQHDAVFEALGADLVLGLGATGSTRWTKQSGG